ncbi:MAG: HtaA domain-containing protein [Corynebacterium glucuronolyticum]|nr:HtaA domain-containing protein [Corynebacterium glucuronolyticum]
MHRFIRLLLAFLLLLAAAPANADTCTAGERKATSGQFTWGVKESYRSYIQTGVAHGAISFSDGAENFTFPLESSTITSNTEGTLRFKGGVHFTGHTVGDVHLLDMNLYNFTVQVNGSQADIAVDYDSRKFVGMSYDNIGPIIHGTNTVIAHIRLNQEANFSSQTVDLSGSTTLADTGKDVFGDFYEPGTALDNTSGSVGICGGKAGTSGGQGSGPGKTDSGATTGIAGRLGDINDTLVEVNGLLVNSGNIMTNSDKLIARFAGGTTTPSTSTSPTPQEPTPLGTVGATKTHSPSTTGGGTPATTAMTPASIKPAGAQGAPPPAPNQDNVCTADSARGISSATATWGVRSSFRTYIRGSIAKGGWKLGGVTYDNDAFTFTGTSGAVDPQSKQGTIMFPGTIQFYGHGGILDLTLSNLEVQFSGTSGNLIAAVKSNDVYGKPHDFGRVSLATLSFNELTTSDTQASAAAQVTLTEAGAHAFADFYTPGTELDPLQFTAQLSGKANCTTGQATAGAAPSSAGPSDQGSAAAILAGGKGSGDSAIATPQLTEDSRSSAPDKNHFQIKSAQAGAQKTDVTATTLLLILAAFIVAGGSLNGFLRRHPSMGGQ